jgi:hypothetical protein
VILAIRQGRVGLIDQIACVRVRAWKGELFSCRAYEDVGDESGAEGKTKRARVMRGQLRWSVRALL